MAIVSVLDPNSGIKTEMPDTAFHTVFEPQGWLLDSIGNTDVTSNTVSDMQFNGVSDNPEEMPEPVLVNPDIQKKTRREVLEETPLSEMGAADLKEYASILGVSLKGVRGNEQARDRIKAFLETAGESAEVKD